MSTIIDNKEITANYSTKIRSMKLKFIYTLFYSSLLFFIVLMLIGFSAGPATQQGGNFTGSPTSTNICGSCHGNPGSFGGVTTLVVITDDFGIPVTEYAAGMTYNVSVTVLNGSGTPAAHGFQCIAVDDTNAQAGSFSAPQTNVKFATSGQIQVAEHKNPSPSPVFEFKWTAPAAFAGGAAGDVTFYSAGNAVNLNFQRTGDSGSSATGSTTLTEATLPIELVSFEGIAQDYSVFLTWSTASESNSYQFIVEHSLDGINFQPVETIQSAGNSTILTNYEFTHRFPSIGKTNYYRLLQVDLDGMKSYSRVVPVILDKKLEEISVFPVPAEDLVNVVLQVDQKDEYQLTISDMSGKLQTSSLHHLVPGTNSIELQTADWPNGVYIFQLTNSQHHFVTQIVKF